MVEPQNTKQKSDSPLLQSNGRNWSFSWTKIQDLFGLDSRHTRIVFFLTIATVLFAAAVSFVLTPPTHFVAGTRITIEDGSSLGQVSLLLQDNNLIRSRVGFEFCAITLGGDKKILAGDYLFKQPIGACAIAARIVGGIFGVPAIRVTIPEGLSNKEAAVILANDLPKFDPNEFIKSAAAQEGYLFPDTYFFADSATASDVRARMKTNFDIKIKPLTADIAASGHSLGDIVIMASLLEKEVATDQDRAIVSGILWKRIAQGMPLQVDAPFLYLLGKTSNELTQADLQIKSQYNTYRNKGLPAGPIGNPGLSSLKAAIHPQASQYLYYLADKNGITHYATTFNEQEANIQKYLR